MYKLIVIIFLSWISLSWATNYYVDKNASGGNNGSSWSNAWESFANINWSQIQPGDSVFISGGSDSTVYNEQLTPTKSGTSGNYIVITKGKSLGHNGKVIIDRNGGATACVWADGAQWIEYNNLHLRNATTYNIRMRNSNNIVSQCSIYVSSGAIEGIDLRASNCIIENNYIWTSSGQNDGQRDGMQCTTGGGHIIRYNTTIIYNEDWDEHCDAWQFWNMAGGCTLYGNYIYQNNTKTTNAQGIYIEDTDNGTWIIYNNVFNMPYAKNGVAIRNSQCDANIYSNTFYSTNSVSANLWVRDDGASSVTNIVIKNNIFYTTSSGSRSLSIQETMGSGCVFDDNLHYAPNLSTPIYYNGSYISLATWNSYSFVGTDIEGNPVFTNTSNEDFTVQDGSLAIDNGTILGSPYNIDMNGISRPQGGGYDIGAYEFTTRGPDITPPEVTGATLLDSVTLKIMFSEMLDETTAEDENNYSISNNIDIFNASLSGSEVSLTTSLHSPGNYTITVSNVEDLAGNVISSNANSAQYEATFNTGELMQLPIIGVIASSTADSQYHAGLTIDGLGYYEDPDSRWATIPMPQYLIFDIGSPKSISETRFSFYGWDFGRIYTYTVLVSNDSTNWNEILTNAQSVQEEWTIDTFTPVVTRFIKLLFITSNNAIPNQEWAHLWEAEVWGSQTTETENEGSIPTDYELRQNFPNPFNPATTIKFTIPVSGEVLIEVFNSLGEKIEILVNQVFDAGKHSVVFNNPNIPSGVYFYRILTQSFQQTKKMILLR